MSFATERFGDGLRIVRLANFVAPSSGGLRTALRELGKDRTRRRSRASR